MIKEKIFRIWLAGFLDGEGYFGLYWKRFWRLNATSTKRSNK
jgi:hypothetical protein